MPSLPQTLALEGCIATIDAMDTQTQTQIAQTIYDRKAGYLPTLFASYFSLIQHGQFAPLSTLTAIPVRLAEQYR
ncbi:hypothetical protein SAMN05216318_11229 [Nitrosomonas eutropha]|nr:hypothetical protein SAMN05216318_11229 [Nitrosomonas eutropha]